MKTVFLVAAILIVVGTVIFVCALASCNWKIGALSTAKFETSEHVITADFSAISISTSVADVVFRPSESGECKVVCRQKVKLRHSVTVGDGVLSVSVTDTRRWYDYIELFSFGKQTVTVYLPKAEYDSLTFKNRTGNTDLPAGFSFGSVSISASTGDVTCLASVADSLDVRLSTGDIHLDGCSLKTVSLTVSTGDIRANEIKAESLTAKASTGDVTLKGLTVSENIDVKTSTGNIRVTDATCAALKAQATTGDAVFVGVTAASSFSVKTSTGDIRLDGCDSAELMLTASTGDVKASLLTDKIVSAKSDTGRIKVPDSTVGGSCKIETDTGNITVTIKQN